MAEPVGGQLMTWEGVSLAASEEIAATTKRTTGEIRSMVSFSSDGAFED